MSTEWTNEANGSISTTGNELEATTLSVTGTATANTLSTGGCTLTGGEVTCTSVHSTSLQSDTLTIEVGGTDKLKIEEDTSLTTDAVKFSIGATAATALRLGESGNVVVESNLQVKGNEIGGHAATAMIIDGSNVQFENNIELNKNGNPTGLPSIMMVSKDGTASYLFVANDGTLRISSTLPTANGDGNPV